MLTVIIYCICISTHSLTRRLTIVSENHAQSMGHFNSQPHKEADHAGSCGCSAFYDFNSQPHKEADPSFLVTKNFIKYFNSQPHKEADIYE